jgi:hypothetical protein
MLDITAYFYPFCSRRPFFLLFFPLSDVAKLRACFPSGAGCKETASGLRNETHDLQGSQCEHTKHQMSHNFCIAPDTQMGCAEIVFEIAIDPLG